MMSFIDLFAAALGAIESDAIAVHEERCISVRNRNASCMRCAEACTSGAISCAGNQLQVQPDLCIGCGTCATACPTCAIEVRTPSDDELTAMVKRSIVKTAGHPVIACETAVAEAGEGVQAGPGAVVLPCLGRVDESVLVGLAAYKASDATLVCGDCGGCQHAPGGALVRHVAEGARNLVAAFGGTMAIRLADEVPDRVLSAGGEAAGGAGAVAEGGMSRRDLFRSAKAGGTRVAGAAVRHELDERLGAPEAPVPAAYRKVGDDGTLSHHVPTRRVRLYNYLKHVGSGQPVASEVSTRVIGAVHIDLDACTSCRMCAVFCPTGAIQKVDEPGPDGFFGVMHRPAACMQCRLCESICRAGAITVSERVPMLQFMGKEAVAYGMKRPDWTPNRPTSMYEKFHNLVGKDLEMCMF